ITLGLFVLVAGGFFTYQYFFKRSTTTFWEMIPEQTVLIYEANECEACSTPNKSNVSLLLEKLLLSNQKQDSLTKKLEFLLLAKKGKAISLHIISKDDFDVVYYFTATQAKALNSVITQWKEAKGTRFSERELNGFKILEFSFNQRLFSCVQLGDGWAGSFTPFLIEDVVRTFENHEEQIFKKQMSQVYAL
ncbi:unnamed protein product, partial [Phaeothamnion confervicola]